MMSDHVEDKTKEHFFPFQKKKKNCDRMVACRMNIAHVQFWFLITWMAERAEKLVNVDHLFLNGGAHNAICKVIDHKKTWFNYKKNASVYDILIVAIK